MTPMTSIPCPLCGGASTTVVFERTGIPLNQNVVCDTPGAARAFPRADLRVALCGTCRFAFNSAFDPSATLYSAAYDNSQTCSPFYRRYLEDEATRLTDAFALSGKNLVEIGCGKGEFLRHLCRDGLNRGLGFDPAYVGPDTAEGGAVRFVCDFFSPRPADPAPDLVCCRHVIEHVPRPLDLLRDVRHWVDPEHGGIVYLETPDLRWILDNGAYWDFYYEHCSYFTPATLTWALRAAGFEVLRTRSLFGGQYFSAEARPTREPHRPETPAADEDQTLERVRQFDRSYRAKIRSWTEHLESAHVSGGSAVWGAASKGVTFVNMLDPDRRRVRFLVDLNPAKQGKHVPGTGHPIVPPEWLKGHPPLPACLINMNPNYLDENRDLLSRMGITLPILSL